MPGNSGGRLTKCPFCSCEADMRRRLPPRELLEPQRHCMHALRRGQLPGSVCPPPNRCAASPAAFSIYGWGGNGALGRKLSTTLTPHAVLVYDWFGGLQAGLGQGACTACPPGYFCPATGLLGFGNYQVRLPKTHLLFTRCSKFFVNISIFDCGRMLPSKPVTLRDASICSVPPAGTQTQAPPRAQCKPLTRLEP